MKRLLKYVLAISAAVLMLGSVAYTYAAPAVAQAWAQATPPAPGVATAPGIPQGDGPGMGRQGRGGGAGQVTTVSADSLTATMADGRTITATLTSETKVTILVTQADGSLSDIKVGDSVRVMGRPDQNGAMTAAAVVILPAGDEAQGQVTVATSTAAANGATLTLQDRSGTTSVVTDSSTTFRLADGTAGTLADVTVGKFVEAYGQKQADGSVAARLVLVKDQPAGPGGPNGGDPQRGRQGRGGGAGQVTTVSADSLTATLADGRTITATLTSETKVTILATQADGSLSDIKVGDSVRVMGRPDQNGAMTAAAVVILPAGDEAQGQVTAATSTAAANGATLTLQDRGGTTSVVTDSNTTFRLADGTAGTLTDVSVSKFVEAYGQKQADGSVAASLVLVKDQPAGPQGGPRGPGDGQPGAGPLFDGHQPPQLGATATPQP
jgi:hypothetical protein